MSALPDDIVRYHAEREPADAAICARLAGLCDEVLVDATRKVWHRHPVWFLAGNPIVGYHRLKAGMRLLFWSGQSFPTPGLKPEGSFKAAEILFKTIDDIDDDLVRRWLADGRRIQWDYEHIMKNKGLVPRSGIG